MAIIRLECLRELERRIKQAIPELETHVLIGHALPGKTMCFPALVIDAVRFRFEADQDWEVFEPTPDKLVENVGRHVATVQLRLAVATAGERYDYQDKLTNLFLSTPGHAGILLTRVTACEALGAFVAAWEMDDDEWQDEKVFDSVFWDVMTLTGQIPALVTREGVFRIDDLRLGLTHEFADGDSDDTIFTADTMDDSPAAEVVRINEDGTFTHV